MAVNAAAVRAVADYAPGAPAEIQAAAVPLVEAFLTIAPESDLRDGGQGATYPHHTLRHAIVHSGAGALLAPYRRPRARVIGPAE